MDVDANAHGTISEKIINDDPHVKSSVMFGRGKFQNGVLIEPTEDYAFDPSDIKQVEMFRNKIWFVCSDVCGTHVTYVSRVGQLSRG